MVIGPVEFVLPVKPFIICSTETLRLARFPARFCTIADFVRTGLRPSQVSGLSRIFMKVRYSEALTNVSTSHSRIAGVMRMPEVSA